MKIRLAIALIVLVSALCGNTYAQSSEDSLRQMIMQLKERLDGMSENMTIISTDVLTLKKFKASGYLQARFEYNDTSKAGITGGNDPAKSLNANNFYIRRGRIKFTFQPGQTSKYVIYFDASKNSVSLKEAYLDLNKLYRGHEFNLTVGQFNWPFGYEIEYSSSKRDFPERSAAENALFKGERDRGINLTYIAPKYLQFNVGLFQGYGIDDRNFTWYDPTKAKDVIARMKAKLGILDVGVSGYWGKTYASGEKAVTTWVDTDGQGDVDPGEVKTTSAKGPIYETHKTRYGADAQIYLDLLPIGSTGIRGEFYYAEDYSKDAKEVVAGRGGYLWLSQPIQTKFGLAARYDYWDVDGNRPGMDEPSTGYSSTQLKSLALGTLSLAAHYYWDSYVRITTAYDIPRLLKDGSLFSAVKDDLKDNRFTLQFQFTY